MGRTVLSGQVRESRKVRVRRSPVPVAAPSRGRRPGARQEGTLWKRKMQSVARRLTRGGRRRHSSGAPMKRG
jgi:hypothetical protein